MQEDGWHFPDGPSHYHLYQKGSVVHHPQYFRYFLSYAAEAYGLGDAKGGSSEEGAGAETAATETRGLWEVPRFFYEVEAADWESAARWVATQLGLSTDRSTDGGSGGDGRGSPAVGSLAPSVARRLDERQRRMNEWWARFKNRLASTVSARLGELGRE